MKKLRCVTMLLAISMLMGCSNNPKAESGVRDVLTPTTLTPLTETTINTETSYPEITITEIYETEEYEEYEENSSTDVVEDTETTENYTFFDYFIYTYSNISPVLVLGDASYLTDAYISTETETGVEYVYTQEKDETRVIEIRYLFNNDGSRSAVVTFDVQGEDTQTITDKMEELYNGETEENISVTFERTELGFKCLDVLSISASKEYENADTPTFDSTIEMVTMNDIMYLIFNPVFETSETVETKRSE